MEENNHAKSILENILINNSLVLNQNIRTLKKL